MIGRIALIVQLVVFAAIAGVLGWNAIETEQHLLATVSLILLISQLTLAVMVAFPQKESSK